MQVSIDPGLPGELGRNSLQGGGGPFLIGDLAFEEGRPACLERAGEKRLQLPEWLRRSQLGADLDHAARTWLHGDPHQPVMEGDDGKAAFPDDAGVDHVGSHWRVLATKQGKEPTENVCARAVLVGAHQSLSSGSVRRICALLGTCQATRQ